MILYLLVIIVVNTYIHIPVISLIMLYKAFNTSNLVGHDSLNVQWMCLIILSIVDTIILVHVAVTGYVVLITGFPHLPIGHYCGNSTSDWDCDHCSFQVLPASVHNSVHLLIARIPTATIVAAAAATAATTRTRIRTSWRLVIVNIVVNNA